MQLGEVHGAFGLRGWIKVRSLTRPPQGIFEYPVWTLGHETGGREFHVRHFQADGDNFLVQLTAVTTREQAEALVGMRVSVPASELPPADSGTYYWRDLIGLEVTTLEGQLLGTVLKLFETGSADVMSVVDGERQRLIPFVVGRYVESVDLAARRIRVDWHPDD